MYGISNFEYLIDKIEYLIYGYDGYRIAFLNATKNTVLVINYIYLFLFDMICLL